MGPDGNWSYSSVNERISQNLCSICAYIGNLRSIHFDRGLGGCHGWGREKTNREWTPLHATKLPSPAKRQRGKEELNRRERREKELERAKGPEVPIPITIAIAILSLGRGSRCGFRCGRG